MATILNLSERMEAILDLCDVKKVIADIGCDHGYISAELILQNKAERVIATDISLDCLNKAINLANTINILPFISFREGNGFQYITKHDKVQQAVIAGVGGEEIINIMLEKPRKLWNFVLQPMSDVIALRKFLLANRFKILVDKLIKEGDKYYNVIKVTYGRQSLTELEIYFGLTNFRENYKVFYEYLMENKAKFDELKSKYGELNFKKEEEYRNILEALSLFEQPEEETPPAESATPKNPEENPEEQENASQGEEEEELPEDISPAQQISSHERRKLEKLAKKQGRGRG